MREIGRPNFKKILYLHPFTFMQKSETFVYFHVHINIFKYEEGFCFVN